MDFSLREIWQQSCPSSEKENHRVTLAPDMDQWRRYQWVDWWWVWREFCFFFWRHALSAQIPLTAFVFSHPNAAPPSYLSSVSPRWSAACGKVRRANRSQQLLLAEAAWPNTEAVKFSARASGALAGRHLSSWRALHRVKYSRQICLARYRAPLYHATLLVSSRKCVIRSIDSQPPSQQA